MLLWPSSPYMTVRRIAVGACVLAAMSGSLTMTSAARADVYWSGERFIGQARNDGSSPDPTFVRRSLDATALAADRSHLYWNNGEASDRIGSIGRSRLNGTRATIFVPKVKQPQGVAVDSTHVYWTTNAGSIGRATTAARPNNRQIDRSFITGLDEPSGIAVDSRHLYWSEGTSIARANLDGTNVDHSFISGLNGPLFSIAVTKSHLYWTERGADRTSTVARARKNGTRVDHGFVPGIAGNATSVAASRSHIYWSVPGVFKPATRALGRARLDGTRVNYELISGADLVPSSSATVLTGLVVSRKSVPARR